MKVEHVYAQQKAHTGLCILTIGIKRAQTKLIPANLANNLQRLIPLVPACHEIVASKITIGHQTAFRALILGANATILPVKPTQPTLKLKISG